MNVWCQEAAKFRERIEYAEHTGTFVSEQEIPEVTGEMVYTSGHSLNDDQERLRNYVTQMNTVEPVGVQMCDESQDNNHRMKLYHIQYRH